MAPRTAVLLMAYGTPNTLEEVEPYYQDIRGGRAPTEEQVEELTNRYRRVGGRSPLLEITRQVATALERRLGDTGDGPYKVYVGMKHWHPKIDEAVGQMAGDGFDSIIGLPLAPHYSTMSIGGYRGALEDAIRSRSLSTPLRFIESWHGNPRFVSSTAERVKEALADLSPEGAAGLEVVFTAHSLPRSIIRLGDPYPQELLRSSEAVAEAAGLVSWRFAYQSASHTGQPWLGPDILETLATLAGEGKDRVLVVPIGFVSDHLEILFDIDVEAQELAKGLNLTLRRTEMPNASPAFIEVLADLVTDGTGARVTDSTDAGRKD